MYLQRRIAFIQALACRHFYAKSSPKQKNPGSFSFEAVFISCFWLPLWRSFACVRVFRFPIFACSMLLESIRLSARLPWDVSFCRTCSVCRIFYVIYVFLCFACSVQSMYGKSASRGLRVSFRLEEIMRKDLPSPHPECASNLRPISQTAPVQHMLPMSSCCLGL